MNRLGRATLFKLLIVRSLFSHLVGGMFGLLSLGSLVSGYAAESAADQIQTRISAAVAKGV
jgi:hypothetical protein